MKTEEQKLIQKAKESLLASQVLADRQLYNFAGSLHSLNIHALYNGFIIRVLFSINWLCCISSEYRMLQSQFNAVAITKLSQ